jgi:hypothetical protein
MSLIPLWGKPFDEIYAEENGENASEVMKDLCWRAQIMPGQLLLHSDNGGSMKGATMQKGARRDRWRPDAERKWSLYARHLWGGSRSYSFLTRRRSIRKCTSRAARGARCLPRKLVGQLGRHTSIP